MNFEGFFWTTMAFLIWAFVHSLTASHRVKGWVRHKVGRRAYDGFYRLAYNLFSVLSILPLLYLLATQIPAAVLWRVPAPLSFLFGAVQVVGLAGLALSLLQTDVLGFVGVRQALRYLRGAQEPDPPGAFVRSGAYALVRHPLYLFSMLLLWFTPLMTVNALLFDLLATIYFLLGAIHEERRLLAEFGEAYRTYRREVPAFLPWPRGP